MCRNIKHTFRNTIITENINFYQKVNPNRKLSGHFKEEYKLWMTHEAQRKSPDILNNSSIWGCTTVQSTNDKKLTAVLRTILKHSTQQLSVFDTVAHSAFPNIKMLNPPNDSHQVWKQTMKGADRRTNTSDFFDVHVTVHS